MDLSQWGRGAADESDDDQSFDDMFDDPSFRASRVFFQGRAHRLAPRSQTHYRPNVENNVGSTQRLPVSADTAHWDVFRVGGKNAPA